MQASMRGGFSLSSQVDRPILGHQYGLTGRHEGGFRRIDPGSSLAAVLALNLVSVPADACKRECEASGKLYSHGAKWNGQQCECRPVYRTGERRSGPPAYYDCNWK